ncbi:ABC transporter substrate-binding protein [Pedobacter suwonensis]|uniref:ABC transporter substrate-binding protein n=1 Tax=Pedobacter suwonensis TaxID=332999 RepID=UPI0011A965B3|nr:ABC transporter substrate-binding protein [Pedobacter suwonensis]
METKKLTVGVLLSNSSILPMAKHFSAGLKNGLKALSQEVELEIVPEFIGQGSRELAENAITKLVGFDGADVITGIVSNKVGVDLSEKIANVKRPFIINNIGEHLPDPEKFNDYMFLNSIHTWQQLWSVGQWGVKNFGKKGMYVSGLYDCGYSFQSMLSAGMESASSGVSMPFAIAPTPNPKEAGDIAAVFEHIHKYKPDFILATFCGKEAEMFLKQYVEQGLHKTTPLLGLPFLLEPFNANEPVEVYTTLSLNRALKQEQLDEVSKVMANPFTQFGFETGLLIAQAVKGRGGKSLQKAIAEAAIETERGRVEVEPRSNAVQSRVYLVKNTFNGVTGEISRQLVAELETIDTEHADVLRVNKQSAACWMNPYLGI